MVRIKKILVGAVTSCLFLSCGSVSFAEGSGELDSLMSAAVGNRTALTLIALIILNMIAGTVLMAASGRKIRANFLWIFIAMVLTAAALLTAVVGGFFGTVYSKANGDPTDTVKEFFDSIKSGNYVIAYACLEDYNELGLENTPADANTVLVYNAIKAAFDYSVSGQAQINKLNAVVPVSVTYLRMQDAQANIEERTNKNIEKMVEELPRNQIYDANEKYLPEVTERAYADALAALLNDTEQFCVTEQLNINLKYSNGQWLILTDTQLLNTLVGGTLQQ